MCSIVRKERSVLLRPLLYSICSVQRFFLYHIVSLVWNEGVDLYEGFGSVAVVVSILFAVLNAAALSHGRLRARCEASGDPCGKMPKLRLLAVLAVFERLG